MGRLFLLFVALPAVELALLIEVGSRIGTAATLALIALTGIAGAALARRQGLRALREIQTQLAEGRMPAESLVDGVLILIAAALLVTPGIVTDAVGFACLVPGARRLVKRSLRRSFERAAKSERVVFSVHVDEGFGREPFRAPPIDVTPPRPGTPPRGGPPSRDGYGSRST